MGPACRRQNGIHVVLRAAFETPGRDWPDGYPKQAALVLGLEGCGSHTEAGGPAALFITPMLDSTAVGAWNP